MFIDNKYTIWYNSIIENRKNNPLRETQYGENHHIVPKSLGGTNRKDNIVRLTAREHYVCHLLLVKMTDGRDKMKMSYAIRCMMHRENEHQERYKISSIMYENIVKITKPAISAFTTGDANPFKGKSHSEETKRTMSKLRKERHSAGNVEGMMDKKHSKETKNKLRKANEEQFKDPNQRELRRKKSKELWADPVWRAKYKGNTGKSWYHNQDKTECRFFLPSDVPDGWVKGRILIKRKGG